MAFHRGRGVIKHGTLRPATDDAVFFVFDVYAINWAAMLLKLSKWLGLIGCFGQAAYTTAKWASALPALTKFEELRQFNGMKTGQAVVDTLDFAALAEPPAARAAASQAAPAAVAMHHVCANTAGLHASTAMHGARWCRGRHEVRQQQPRALLEDSRRAPAPAVLANNRRLQQPALAPTAGGGSNNRFFLSPEEARALGHFVASLRFFGGRAALLGL
jgi:hypothetical protein